MNCADVFDTTSACSGYWQTARREHVAQRSAFATALHIMSHYIASQVLESYSEMQKNQCPATHVHVTIVALLHEAGSSPLRMDQQLTWLW